MDMKRTTVLLSLPVIALSILLATAVSAGKTRPDTFSMEGIPRSLECCGKKDLCFQMLWPADPTRPGKDLKMLHVRPVNSNQHMHTPAGKVYCSKADWIYDNGDNVASSSLCEVPAGDGFKAYVISTTTKKDINAPVNDFNRPHFALPAIKPPYNTDRVLSFKEEAFAPPVFSPQASMGPTVLYNDDMDVIVISSLNHFLSSIQSPVKGRWWCGFQGEIERVPSGTEFRVLVVRGHGINATVTKWGSILRLWHGKERPSPYEDVGLSRLGYWTDNGGYYYYNTAPGKNYEQTLLSVKEYADRENIPYGYFQIDSWWYPKAEYKKPGASGGGAVVWEPMEKHFPQGLDSFGEKLGLPLIAHNRWYDENTPYCNKFECVYGEGPRKPALPVDPRFWQVIMDNAVSYGVEVYEQDWLDTQYRMIPWLRKRIGRAESWFDAMIKQAREHDLTVQLCMASPGFFLQQVKHDNVTQVRTTRDYHAYMSKERYWPVFHVNNLMAYAVGLWPFKDNFHTTPGQHMVVGERWPYEETLISILSAGVVGPSDKIGASDADLLRKTCRKDGVLLKPDRPATAVDIMFLDNNKPLIVTTESKHKTGVTTYLAAFNLKPILNRDTEVSFKQIGVQGKNLVWNYRERRAFTSSTGIDFGRMSRNKAHYYVICPLLENGMAVIGEADKFVTLSKKRFARIEYEGGAVVMELEGVPGESVDVYVYSPAKPEEVTGHKIVNTKYISAKNLQSTEVVISEAGTSVLKIK